MSGEQFLEKYRNWKWMELLDNDEVRQFILSYPNIRSKKTMCSTIYALVRKAREDNPEFDISNLLDMDSINARQLIWNVCLAYIEEEKYRTAEMVKIHLKSLYDFVHELRRDNQTINWHRRNQIPKVKTRETEVPTHSQIYRLVDKTVHIEVQTMFLLSYSSGLKGQGLLGLKVKHLRKALEDREKLREEFKAEYSKVEDPKAKRDLETLINNLPLIFKIDGSIYPKRFKGNNLADWYPAIVCNDAEKLLMR
jgi:hypothetical protein